MELSEIIEALNEVEPDKVIVDISEYEAPDKQTYKFLYENLIQNFDELTNDYNSLLVDQQNSVRDLADALARIDSQNEEISNLKKLINSKINIFLSNFCKEVVVSDIESFNKNASPEENNISPDCLVNSISSKPAVYKHKRPSFFIPLDTDILSRESIIDKNKKHTAGILKDRFNFIRKLNKHEISNQEAADEYDDVRYNNIKELLVSNCSNEEKYLKYILLSPGIDKEFIQVIEKASKLNLNANLIISLLEQRTEMFNEEVIELYTSQLYKSNEYNLKQELAEELIKGDWVIYAEVNNKKQLFQLVPIDELKDINNKLDTIIKILSDDTFSCAESAQENKLDDIQDYYKSENNDLIDLPESEMFIDDDTISSHIEEDTYDDSNIQINF